MSDGCGGNGSFPGNTTGFGPSGPSFQLGPNGGPPPPRPAPLVPVKFDFEAADNLVIQLQQSANSVLEGAAVMRKEAASTTDGWSGSFRGTFDADLIQLLAGAEMVADTFNNQAAQVMALAYEAEVHNQWVAQQNAINGYSTPPDGTPPPPGPCGG